MNTTRFHGSSHLDGGGASIGGGGHCPAVRVRRVALRGRATGGAAVPVIFLGFGVWKNDDLDAIDFRC